MRWSRGCYQSAPERERLARFEREAKLLAGLNHPNIATLYGLDNVDGEQLLIMLEVSVESMKFLLALAFSGLLMASPLSAQTVGESLPPWTLGVLDIHQIHTGGGNVALLIFPDGTSLLVDAGDGNPEPPRGATRAPDRSRRPGEWIARYAHRMLAHDPEPAIDYAFITHFHGDHMGRIYPESKDSAAGDYKLTGVTDVAEHIPIRMMLDRGWPDYDYPRPLDNPMMHNYHAFLEASRVRHGMKVARFQPGRSDQIVLKREPNRYASFEVRNIAANGEVWTGVTAMTRQHFPPLADTPAEDWPTENQCSMAIRVSYGSFDYYTGGDMPGQPRPGYPLWHDIETAVAEAVGAVAAAVLNHHGIGDGTTESFVRGLRPRVWIIPARAAGHPDRWVLNRLYSTRLYPGPRDVFSLTLQEATRQIVGEPLAGLKSQQGHIVLRVAEHGNSYLVVILDDASEANTVKAVHGPYEAR